MRGRCRLWSTTMRIHVSEPGRSAALRDYLARLGAVVVPLSGEDARAVRLVPREVGLRYAAIPVRFVEGVLQVAFADPSDPEAIEAISGYVHGLTAAVSELSDIEAAWRLLAA